MATSGVVLGASRLPSTCRPRVWAVMLKLGAMLVLGAGVHDQLGAQTASRFETADGLRFEGIADRRRAKTLPELRAIVQNPLPQAEADAEAVAVQRALAYCVVPELMQRTGDTRAPELYRKATALDPTSPDVHWLLGDNFRNARGPLQPLFSEAEREYFEALRKLRARASRGRPDDRDLETGVKRSRIALYERDGLPLLKDIDSDHPPFLYLRGQDATAPTISAILRLRPVSPARGIG